MKKRTKKMDWSKHAAVLTITVLVFVMGILLGNLLNQHKIDAIADITEELRFNTMSSELEFALLTANPCSVTDLQFLRDDLREISSKVEYMENQLGSSNKAVLELKNHYSIVQIRHWLLMNKIRKECQAETIPIIYFYSNEGDCDECTVQGYILSHLRKNEPVAVYSVDANLNNKAVQTLKKVYDVNATPTLIIDDIVYPNFMSMDDLTAIIKN